MSETNKPENNVQLHWSEEKEEVHGHAAMIFLVKLIKIFPRWFVHLIAVFPTAFFYLIFSSRGRREIKRYQTQLNEFFGQKRRIHYYAQIFSFALSVAEKFEGWIGKIPDNDMSYCDDDREDLDNRLENGKGVIFICSHLGNNELLRCIGNYRKIYATKSIPMAVIMNVSTTTNFNDMLKAVNPDSAMNIIDPEKIGIDTMTYLSDCIEKGGIVVIAGDRTSKNTLNRSFTESFLGKKALFPYGSFLLAVLLNAPIYFVFGLRTKTITLFPKYKMHVHLAKTALDCPRKERDKAIEKLCKEFVILLEKYCKEYPFQWYNFFNYWAIPENFKEAEQ